VRRAPVGTTTVVPTPTRAARFGRPPLLGLLLPLAAALGGRVLAAATAAVAAVRPAAKPLHPRGSVDRARLVRRGAAEERSGAAWIDQPGTDQVLVRRSRAIGLPPPLPDIHGLAVRVPAADGGYGDLLLATTGLGRVTRFLLTFAATPEGRPMTTLLPYRSPTGPVLVAARHRSEDVLELAWARPRGPWRPFAELRLPPRGVEAGADRSGDPDAAAPDARVSFDPVRHELPGLTYDGWVRRLREPAYRTARRSRSV